MPRKAKTKEFHPVTPERLPDLARFSERHGKFRWCSCLRWRWPSSAFQGSTKDERVAALDALVRAETPVGILGYLDGEPVAWCSIAPRATYAAVKRSRTIPRGDAAPADASAWAVVCFFVDRSVRRQGLTVALLQAAVAYARAQGARVIEGYPVDPGGTYTYMGSPATFQEAGFHEVDLPHPPAGHRRLMRYVVDPEAAR